MLFATLGALRHSPDFLTLSSRAMLGFLGACVALFLCFRGVPAGLTRLTRRSFDISATAGFALLHLAIFLPLVLSHVPLHADVPSFYLPQAQEVLNGKIPYVDFHSSYGPLHSYLDAAALHIWNNGYALLLLVILCDVAAFPIWLTALRRWLPEDRTRCVALMVMTQPLLLWNIAVDGRNDAIIFLLLGTAVALVARSDFFSGMAATAPLVAVKFLPVILIPHIFAAARRRWLWICGGLLLPVIGYGALLAMHADILQSLKTEGAIATAGGAPYAFTALTGLAVPPAVSGIILAAAYVFALLWLTRSSLRATNDREKMSVLMCGILALQLVLLFFSKKSYPVYLLPAAVPLAAYTLQTFHRGRRITAVVYALLLVFSMIQTSLWYGPMASESASSLHADLMGGSPFASFEFLVMALPAACYLYLLVSILRDLSTQRDMA